jgi:hypothetical protein
VSVYICVHLCVHLCVCTHVCVCVYIRVFTSVCVSTSVNTLCVYICVYISVCVSMCVPLCMSVYTSVCVSICACVFVSVPIDVCVSVCVHTCVCEISWVYIHSLLLLAGEKVTSDMVRGQIETGIQLLFPFSAPTHTATSSWPPFTPWGTVWRPVARLRAKVKLAGTHSFPGVPWPNAWSAWGEAGRLPQVSSRSPLELANPGQVLKKQGRED